MAGPGQPKTGGRVKGAPNKATAAVKEAIVAAFHEVGGKDYLVEVARSDPKVFCTLLSKLVPAQVRAELDYHWTDQLSTGFRYLYQRFDLNDSFTDNVVPYGNPDDLQGNTLDYFIFLDANYRDYTAHLFTVTVSYTF